MKSGVKHILLLVSCMFIFNGVGSAQDSIINNTRSNNVIIQFKLPSYTISDTILPEEYGVIDTFKYIHMADESYGIIDSVGLPVLPQKTFTLTLPANVQSVSASITNASFSTIDITSHILPCQEDISKDSIVFNYTIDNTYYSSGGGAFNTLYELDDIFDVHGVKGILLSVMPFIYNPSKKQLQILQQTTITLSYTCDSVGDSTYSISQVWDDYLSHFFDNYTPTVRDNTSAGRYLIITHPKFASTIQQFADYKRNIGYDVDIITTSSTGWTPLQIKDTIIMRYISPSTRPDFVLLTGGHQYIPVAAGDSSMEDEDNPITDLPYSLLFGGNYFSDVFVGRFPVSDSLDLKTIINKTISMEMHLPLYDKKAKFIAGNESNYFVRKSFESSHDTVVKDFFIPNGYACQKLYQVDRTTALNALNDNPLLYIYSGHGSEIQWAARTFNMNSLFITSSRHDTYPISMAFACRTGNYAYETCIGEQWIIKRSGGVCYIGCSITSKTNTDIALEKKMLGSAYFDNSHIGPIFALGLKKFKDGFVWFAGEKTKKRYMKAYNLLGDPAFNVTGVGYKKNLTLVNHNIYSGDTVYYFANDTLQTTGNIVVHNGGIADVSARIEITLQPGFEVQHGGACHLYLHNLSRNESKARSQIMETTYQVEEDNSYDNQLVNVSFWCFPNPTSGQLNIQYKVKEEQSISIDVYNVYGVLVQELFNGVRGCGVFCEKYNLDMLPVGTYFIRFVSKNGQYVQKIIKH